MMIISNKLNKKKEVQKTKMKIFIFPFFYKDKNYYYVEKNVYNKIIIDKYFMLWIFKTKKTYENSID